MGSCFDEPMATMAVNEPPIVADARAFAEISERLDRLFQEYRKIEAEITQTRNAYREARARVIERLDAGNDAPRKVVQS